MKTTTLLAGSPFLGGQDPRGQAPAGPFCLSFLVRALLSAAVFLCRFVLYMHQHAYGSHSGELV